MQHIAQRLEKNILVGESNRKSGHSRSLARYTCVRVCRVLMIGRANKQNVLLKNHVIDTRFVVLFLMSALKSNAAYTDVYSLDKHLAFLSSTWRFVQPLTLTTGESVQGNR